MLFCTYAIESPDIPDSTFAKCDVILSKLMTQINVKALIASEIQ